MVQIPTRDGATLVGDLYTPRAPGRYPTIIELTPYGRRGPLAFVNERDFWPSHGYAFMIVDARGQGDSGGQFAFMRDGGRDAHDIVEWAATRQWSDSKVGMRGSSFSGTVPWHAARLKPPHLRCINANASVADPFVGPPYMGGAFMQEWGLSWIPSFGQRGFKPSGPPDFDKLLNHRPVLTADVAAHGVKLDLYHQFLRHPTRDQFWRPITMSPEDYARIAIPTLAFSGWFDGTLPGTIHSYRSMKRLSPAAKDQFLVIGPWQHHNAPDGGWDYDTGAQTDGVGDFKLPPQASVPAQRMTREFFDWCLKGASRPQQSSARLYITGADRWIDADGFESPRRPLSLYLGSRGSARGAGGGGRLSWKRASGRADHYMFDPASPVRSYLVQAGKKRSLVGEPVDIGSQLDRPDVVTYTSAPVERAMTLLGTVKLELFASSSARDADWVARIEDVAPNGTAVKLGSANGGVLRARYRHGFERAIPLTPGKVERYMISLGDVGHELLQGHRLRLSITSSSYPMITVNSGSGRDIATDISPPRTARQTIHHDPTRASRLLLPMAPPQQP